MTTLLAIDTATDYCSVALLHNGKVTSRLHSSAREHTEHLLAIVDELCSEANIAINALDAIALTTGPGSFTGLRIGLATAQGLAYAYDLPLVAVDTLESMVATYYQNSGYEGHYIAMIDARINDIVYAHVVMASGQLSVLKPSSIAPIEQVNAYINQLDEAFCIVGSGARLINTHNALLKHSDPDAYSDASQVIARAVASKQAYQPIDSVEPRYFRDEINWQKRQRIRQ